VRREIGKELLYISLSLLHCNPNDDPDHSGNDQKDDKEDAEFCPRRFLIGTRLSKLYDSLFRCHNGAFHAALDAVYHGLRVFHQLGHIDEKVVDLDHGLFQIPDRIVPLINVKVLEVHLLLPLVKVIVPVYIVLPLVYGKLWGIGSVVRTSIGKVWILLGFLLLGQRMGSFLLGGIFGDVSKLLE